MEPLIEFGEHCFLDIVISDNISNEHIIAVMSKFMIDILMVLALDSQAVATDRHADMKQPVGVGVAARIAD